MRNRWKKILAAVCTAALMLSCMPVQAMGGQSTDKDAPDYTVEVQEPEEAEAYVTEDEVADEAFETDAIEEDIVSDEPVSAAVTTELSDWDYLAGEDSVTLYQYKGDAADIIIPASFTVEDKTYNTILEGVHYNYKKGKGDDYGEYPTFPHEVSSITIENGVKAAADISYLFTRANSAATGHDPVPVALDLSGLDTSSVTNMSRLFCAIEIKSLQLGTFDTSHVTTMKQMFNNCELSGTDSLKLDFNVAELIDAEDMFTSFNFQGNLDVSGWETAPKLTKAWRMFCGVKSITLGSLSLPALADAYEMFMRYDGTTLDVSGLSIPELSNANEMFYGCTNLTSLDFTNWKNGKLTNADSMFCGCSNITEIEGLKSGSALNSMKDIFYGCLKLPSMDLSGLDLSNVRNASAAFSHCKKLTSVTFPSQTLGNIDMSGAFTNCEALPSIDLSNLTIAGNCSIGALFEGCYELTTARLPKFSQTTVPYNVSVSQMFNGCRKLTGFDCTGSFDTEYVKLDGMAYMFKGCTSLVFLDMRSWKDEAVGYVERTTEMFYGCTSLKYLWLPAISSKLPTGAEVFNDRMLMDCTALEFADMSKMNMTYCKEDNAFRMLYNTPKLERLRAPLNAVPGADSAGLGGTFYDKDGTSYMALPEGLSKSILLKRGSAPTEADETDPVPEEPEPGDDKGKVKGVTLDKTTLTCNVGEYFVIKATLNPTTATNQKVTWISSPATGLIGEADDTATGGVAGCTKKANTDGTWVITVKTDDGGYTASCTVKVGNGGGGPTPPEPGDEDAVYEKLPSGADTTTKVSSVKFAKSTMKLAMGDAAESNTATVKPVNNVTPPSLYYVTSNKDIVSVNQKGSFTAKSAGTATVTAYCGNKKAVCKVTVSDYTKDIKILDHNRKDVTQRTISMNAGEMELLSVSFDPIGTTDPRDVTWKTSNKKVATVAGGLITAQFVNEAQTVDITASVKVTDPATGKTSKIPLTKTVSILVEPNILDALPVQTKDNKLPIGFKKSSVKMVTTGDSNTYDLEITCTPKKDADVYRLMGSCNEDIVTVGSVTSFVKTKKNYVATATLTAKAPGTTYVYYTLNEGKELDMDHANIKRCKVTVTSPAESITTDAGEGITLRYGAYQFVDASVVPALSTDGGKIKWSASGGVTVKNGLVYAKSKTSKQSYVTVKCGKQTKKIPVTVTE